MLCLKRNIGIVHCVAYSELKHPPGIVLVLTLTLYSNVGILPFVLYPYLNVHVQLVLLNSGGAKPSMCQVLIALTLHMGVVIIVLLDADSLERFINPSLTFSFHLTARGFDLFIEANICSEITQWGFKWGLCYARLEACCTNAFSHCPRCQTSG